MTNNTETTVPTYTEHRSGFMSHGGDLGGDRQVTDAPSRRFLAPLPSGETAVIDVYAYGTHEGDDKDDNTTANDVCVQTMYTVCGDPEDISTTETYSDITYEHPYALAPRDNEQALDWATNYIRGLNAADFLWTGAPIEH